MRALFDKNKVLVAFTAIIAFSIQTQLTFFETETYAGIRLNLTDLILPIAGLFIFVSLLLNKSQWPQFHIKHIYLLLALLTVIMVGSFIHGYIRYGELNQWAAINKTLGWFILCSYFLMGAWLIQNSPKDSIATFFKYFLISFIGLTIILSTIYLIENIGLTKLEAYGLKAFSSSMGNKNAYTFLFLFCFCLSFTFKARIKNINLSDIMLILLPTIFGLTGSRMLPAMMIIVFILFLVLKIPVFTKQNLIALTLGFALAGALYLGSPKSSRHIGSYLSTIKEYPVYSGTQASNYTIKTAYSGDQNRLKIIDTSLNMIKERPITGHGLASAQYEQEKQWGEILNIIDSTPLWLWTELGLIGLLGFLYLYFLCLQRGWSMLKDENDLVKKIGQTLICLLVVFSFMSLLHEILYTRFLWLIMGMCLVYPAIHSAKKLN